MRVSFASELGSRPRDATIEAGDRALYQIAEGPAAQAQEKGETRKDISAQEIARIIVRSARGIVYEWCLYDGDFDLVEAARYLLAVLIDGLKP
jgi:TetR/AcrR family fatty acid metabolism transcriptional regulator